MDTDQFRAEMAEREVQSFAHMTNADIERWIERWTAERSAPLYHLIVSSYEADKTEENLFRYQRELERRLRIKIAEDDAAIANLLGVMAERAANFRELADALSPALVAAE